MAAAAAAAEDQYTVEAILRERIDPTSNQLLYEVKWLGYADEENTWERPEDLIGDGHGAAVEKYRRSKENNNKESATPDKKKKREGSSRSKTPVKRTQTKKPKSPGNKLEYEYGAGEAEDDNLVSAKGVDKSALKRSERDAAELASLESPSRLVKFVLVGFFLVISIGLALEASSVQNAYTRLALRSSPWIVGLLLLQVFGTDHPSVNSASKAAVWLSFSELLVSGLVPPGPMLYGVTEGIWRYEAAKAAGATMLSSSVLIVSIVCWFLVSYEGRDSLNIDQVASFLSFWGSVAAIDKWAERRSVLNFLNALGTGAGLIACYTPEAEWRMAAFGFVTVAAVLRSHKQ